MFIRVGQTASLSKAFSALDVEAFAKLSLDTNDLHLDDNYAQTTIFHQRIVHGFLAGSLISAVIGTLLPGKGAIYLHQDMDFKRPVYIDEKITAIVTIVEANTEKGIYTLMTECFNDEHELKIMGKAIIKYINK